MRRWRPSPARRREPFDETAQKGQGRLEDAGHGQAGGRTGRNPGDSYDPRKAPISRHNFLGSGRGGGIQPGVETPEGWVVVPTRSGHKKTSFAVNLFQTDYDVAASR